MTFTTIRILRIELTVQDLEIAERFFVDGLGFAAISRGNVDKAMAGLLGAETITAVELNRGGQTLVLQAFQPPGAPYPEVRSSCDQLFQHFALPVVDMRYSYARVQACGPLPVSGQPQQLPAQSGGAIAFKFRDPEGHPLELIRFADGHTGGIDHSAIVVMDVERSIAFYRDHLGFEVASRQVNTGAEQDRLDDLNKVIVDVVALQPVDATPHLELLGYRMPPVRPMQEQRPHDVAATRLMLEVNDLPAEATRLADGRRAMLLHDPDRHALLLISAAQVQTKHIRDLPKKVDDH